MKRTNSLGFSHGLLLPVLVILLVIGGVSYYVYSKNSNGSLNSETEQTTEPLPEPLPDSLLSVSKLKELVNTHKPGQAITGVELEQEEDGLVYKISLADGTVLLFNAETGSLVSTSVEDSRQEENDLPDDFTVGVDFIKARSIALDEKPGATITKMELEAEDGAVVYNIRFSDKSRIIINAKSGKIIRIRHPESSDNTADNKGASASGKSDDSSDDNGSSHRSGNDSDDDNGNSGSGSDDSGGGSHGSDND